jgi:hypothetical protein
VIHSVHHALDEPVSERLVQEREHLVAIGGMREHESCNRIGILGATRERRAEHRDAEAGRVDRRSFGMGVRIAAAFAIERHARSTQSLDTPPRVGRRM